MAPPYLAEAQARPPADPTNAPYHLPELGNKIAYQANREGIADRFPDPHVRKSIEIDLALIEYDDQLLNDLEL